LTDALGLAVMTGAHHDIAGFHRILQEFSQTLPPILLWWCQPPSFEVNQM
jgi:hypothetical protein